MRKKKECCNTPFLFVANFVAYFLLSSHLQIRWQIVPATTEEIIVIIISMRNHLLRLVGDGQRDNCIINISVCQYGILTPRRASGGRKDFWYNVSKVRLRYLLSKGNQNHGIIPASKGAWLYAKCERIKGRGKP